MTSKGNGDLPELVGDAGPDAARLRDALAELAPPPKAPPQLLRERLLAAAVRPRLRYAPLYDRLSALFDLSDTELSSLFELAAQPERWVSAPIPELELFHLTGGPRVAGADNGLVRIRAGARFPLHRHLGPERVLVLEGGYRDEPSGRVYAAGELHEMSEGSEHGYVALAERDLLLAVSVVRGVDVEGFGALSPSSK